jgi:hypothetical protein
MARKILVLVAVFSLLTSAGLTNEVPRTETVVCRVMEVVVAERLGATVVIFHQRDKADGPRLGELLRAYSGAEIEFETRDGQCHRATVTRIKSCFGRGLLIFRADEARLTEKEDFVLRVPEKR